MTPDKALKKQAQIVKESAARLKADATRLKAEKKKLAALAKKGRKEFGPLAAALIQYARRQSPAWQENVLAGMVKYLADDEVYGEKKYTKSVAATWDKYVVKSEETTPETDQGKDTENTQDDPEKKKGD